MGRNLLKRIRGRCGKSNILGEEAVVQVTEDELREDEEFASLSFEEVLRQEKLASSKRIRGRSGKSNMLGEEAVAQVSEDDLRKDEEFASLSFEELLRQEKK